MSMKRGNLRNDIINSVSEYTFPTRSNASRNDDGRVLGKMINLKNAKNLSSLANRLNNLSKDPAINPRFAPKIKFYSEVARERSRKRTLKNRFFNLFK